MINGIYKYEDTNDFRNDGKIVLQLKESEKSYNFQLVVNTMRYSPAHIDMMFSKSDKARVPKANSPHAINFGEDYFVIYPYRAGIPFLFDLVKE